MSYRTLPAKGIVYVLRSSKHPGICKVGRTIRDTSARVRELDAAPGYRELGPWEIILSYAADDAAHVESAAHRALAPKHLRVGAFAADELFLVSAAEACSEVRAAGRTRRRGRDDAPVRVVTTRTWARPRTADTWRGRSLWQVCVILTALLAAAALLAH